MKSKNILLYFAMLLIFVFTACNRQVKNTEIKPTTSTEAQIELIQFHSEHRCMTCNKIEELSKEALNGYPDIPFSLVNVDDDKNEEKAEAFEAYGTALFLYNPATGEKKNLTEFAFMNAGNEEKFDAELKKEIELFQKR